MPIAKNTLKNFSLFTDSIGFAGYIEEFQPPKLALKTEEHRAGGMDAPVELDMGMEKLEASGTLTGFDDEVLKLIGKNANFTARGNLFTHGGAETAVEIKMTALVKSLEPGAWKSGEKATLKFELALTYYKYTQGVEALHEIDVPNMIRIINGIDQLATARKNLGL